MLAGATETHLEPRRTAQRNMEGSTGRLPATVPPTRQPASGSRLRRRVGALLLGLFLALSSVELALRITAWTPPARRSKRSLIDRSPEHRAWYDCYASNPNGEFRELPSISGGSWVLVDNLLPPAPLPLERVRETPWCVEYELTASNLRDVERTPEPAPGVLRVALVGDSFVFGEGVPLERSLPVRMQADLGATFEILNLGWPGDDTARETERLAAAVGALHVQRAVVVFIANDVGMTPELQREQEYINDLVQVRDVYFARHRAAGGSIGGSRLLDLVGAMIDMRRVTAKTIRWYRDLYDPARNAVGLRALRESFLRLAKIEGCRVVLVLYPLLEDLEGAYPLQPVHDAVAAMARSSGLQVLDLAASFRGERTTALWVHPSDHHPNGRAHAIACRAIGEWLRRDVPGFLAP